LPFIVAATEIGQAMGVITRGTAAAFVTAGLVSALVFPMTAVALVRRTEQIEVSAPRL
jgi:hypothetical protein